ncbi:MAG: 50S ribosomal protein L23 [Patescibacteria group bacterium]
MNRLTLIPVITEKSIQDVKSGKFTFRIPKEVGKNSIKRAIENKFGVTVTGISTNIIKGRTARTGVRRIERELPSFKKAVVTLKKGEKIDLFETA